LIARYSAPAAYQQQPDFRKNLEKKEMSVPASQDDETESSLDLAIIYRIGSRQFWIAN